MDVKALLIHCTPIIVNILINWRYNFNFNTIYDFRVEDIGLYFITGDFVFTIIHSEGNHPNRSRSCSKNINVNIVCGPSRMNAGTYPL